MNKDLYIQLYSTEPKIVEIVRETAQQRANVLGHSVTILHPQGHVVDVIHPSV